MTTTTNTHRIDDVTEAFFFRVFTYDLAPHQDTAESGDDMVTMARQVVEWHHDNDPDNNVVAPYQAVFFLAWLDRNRASLAADCDWAYFGGDE